MTAFHASAPLALVLVGAETLALGSLVDGGGVTVRLSLRASATAARASGPRSDVRGAGRTLVVEPDLAPPDDEGELAAEAWLLRGVGPMAPVACTTDAPAWLDLGALEARALALGSALAALEERAADRALALRAAARAGSPVAAALALVPEKGALACTVAGLRGSRTVVRDDVPDWLDHVVLVRDRHAPPGPTAGAALAAWHSGDAAKRSALVRAANAARAAAEAVIANRPESLPGLLADEDGALEAIVPPAQRDRQVEDELLRAGATVVRRQGERGLLVLWVERARREELFARVLDLGLERIDAAPCPEGVALVGRR